MSKHMMNVKFYFFILLLIPISIPTVNAAELPESSNMEAILEKILVSYDEPSGDEDWKEGCKNNSSLPGISMLCSFLKYKKNCIDAEKFLNSIPNSAAELNELWELDSLTMRANNSRKSIGTYWTKGSIGNMFIDLVFNLASEDNKLAIQKIFVLTEASDGSYAEYIDEKMLKFISMRPDLFIENWAIFGKHRDLIYLDSTNYTSEYDSILETYQSYCEHKKSNGCEDVIQFLKKKKIDIEATESE